MKYHIYIQRSVLDNIYRMQRLFRILVILVVAMIAFLLQYINYTDMIYCTIADRRYLET